MLIHKDTKRSEIYYQIYKTISLVNDWNMMDMDLRVFGQLLYEYKELHLRYTEDILNTVFLDKKMKDRLIITLDTTYHSLMNSIARLKKLGLLNEKNMINPDHLRLTVPDAPIVSITIQFYMK